jgi:GntR family transcriptional regulator, arabinose operon transcriptional repressor
LSNYLYLEIASNLRGRIERGDFAGGRLPSERDLTDEFKVQRATVRRALKTLENEGMIFRDTTRGTFARQRVPSGRKPQTEKGGIALVVGRASDTTAPGDIARGLAQVVRAADRFLVWFDTPAAPGHAEVEIPDADDLLARGVAACALWPRVPASVERLRALRDAMPLVLLDRRVPGFESDFVGIDDAAAAKTVTAHLISVGHRRIGFVATNPHVGTVQNRYRGWAEAQLEAGIAPDDSRVLFKTGDLGEADDPLLERLISGGREPLTALVCSNDTVAAHVLRFLNTRGTRVGEEFAVTGFGNAFPTLLDAVGLTTVAQPFEEMGRAAGEILLSRLNDGSDTSARTREAELAVELVVRRSCGVGRFQGRG